jgi:UDP-2,3-diacylglucosamine pyrophosphatase LpxH
MSLEKSIFVISDLHIGDGSSKDKFYRKKRQTLLRYFIDDVARQGGELVILGDFLELWQYPIDRVVSANSALLDHLSQIDTIYVPGNHDAAILSIGDDGSLPHPFFGRTTGPFIRTIGDKRFKFMHGHEVDPFMWNGVESTARFFRTFTNLIEPRSECIALSREIMIEAFLELGECFWVLGKWLENRLSQAVEQCWAAMPYENLAGLKRGLRLYNMLRRHNEHRMRGLYDIAVAGHTHRAGQFGDWYFNSGSWTGWKNNFLRISPDGAVEVFDWDENGPQSRTSALRR